MSKLKIAIQKNGRLTEKSLSLLNECGIKINNDGRILKTSADNFPMEVLFLRNEDIPEYVSQGVAHIGITGQNEVWEKAKPIKSILPLGFGHCKLCLAIPKDITYPGLSYFESKRIATSYPRIIKTFFDQNKINVEIEELGGSVEIATGIGLADAIFDIVSTGSTLMLNGLKEVEVIEKSQSILIANQNLDPDMSVILDKLVFRIKSVLKARENKYILLNAPNTSVSKICSILPGIKSPTIVPLAEDGWSSLHSVVQEDAFWDVIDQLKEAGAQGILVIPIEKMIL